MARDWFYAGEQSIIIMQDLRDVALTHNEGKLRLTDATAKLVISYGLNRGSGAVSLSRIPVPTPGTWCSPTSTQIGFREISSSLMPGEYWLHLPNVVTTPGNESVALSFSGGGVIPF